MFPIPLTSNWLRVAAIAAVIALVGLLGYKIYSAGEAHVSTQWELANAKVAQAVAVDNADKAAAYNNAIDKLAEKDKQNKDQLAKLAEYGISQQQAEKDLKNAYSKLSIYRDANGLLWRQTATNGTNSDQVSTVPVGTSSGGQIPNTTVTRRPDALEISCARETVLYNSCIGKLEALYVQFKQPFYYEQP